MSINRFLEDFRALESDVVNKFHAHQSKGFNHVNLSDEQVELDNLLQDLYDYCNSFGHEELEVKLSSFLPQSRNHGFHPTLSVSEMIAKITRIIRVVETFGRTALDQEKQSLVLEPSAIEAKSNPVGVEIKNSTKVFIVHGHDTVLLLKCKELLTILGLQPIILHEQTNQGMTIIEKFEANADVGYAVVLMTADDMGGSLKEVENETLNKRARQNVIMELGYFAAKLGRSKVAVLLQDGVERPSDISGVVYIDIDSHDAWKFAFAKELAGAGYKIDTNKLL